MNYMKNMEEIRKTRYIDVPFQYDSIIKSKATSATIYRGAILLTPGKFADKITNDFVLYKAEILRKYAKNWISNYLNLDHSRFPLHRIGYVENPRFQDNALKGDLYIFPLTTTAKDTIALIDNGLVNKLSIEMRTDDYYDYREGCIIADDIEFIGCAVVTNPADPHTRIK